MPRMEATSGEAQDAALGLAFDRRLKLEFHGTKVTSDGGLLACRELDEMWHCTAPGFLDTRCCYAAALIGASAANHSRLV